ncbi:MAG: hypothetical protein JSV22_12315 [Bacteroidales bacterium]|nr:MAG: hypothetical protein JSV22_12315 [Bacteroidales bacterium]
MKGYISIIFILFFVNLFAQEEKDIIKQNSFQLDFGINQIKERNLHPKVHGGISYGLTYEHTKRSKNTSNFGVGLVLSRLKTEYEDLSASVNIKLSGNYSYIFKVVNKNKLVYSVGPEAVLYYNFGFYPNWDESHFYWADYLELGIANNLTYKINKNRSVEISLSLPLVSVFSRPELNRQYKIDNISFNGILDNLHSNLEGGTIDKSFIAFSRMEYQFHISDRVIQAICYSYNYQRLKSKEGFSFQDNQHNIGFKLYF